MKAVVTPARALCYSRPVRAAGPHGRHTPRPPANRAEPTPRCAGRLDLHPPNPMTDTPDNRQLFGQPLSEFERLSPDARIRTRRSSGPTFGASTSRTSRTSGPPGRVMTAARMRCMVECRAMNARGCELERTRETGRERGTYGNQGH